MSEPTGARKGIIDGTHRVLRELLDSPRFRQSVRILLGELDPENTPDLVRTLLSRDPELMLSALSASPQVANVAIWGARTFLAELDKFTPDLLAGFLTQMAHEVQAEQLGETFGLLSVLVLRAGDAADGGLDEALKELWQRVSKGFTDALAAQGVQRGQLGEGLARALVAGVNVLAADADERAKKGDPAIEKNVALVARGIRDVARKNPAFMHQVVRPLVEAGRDAINEANDEEDS